MMRAQHVRNNKVIASTFIDKHGVFRRQLVPEAGDSIAIETWCPAFGDRVMLAPFEDNPREEATVLQYRNNCLLVRVKVTAPGDDDGLRELPIEQVEDLL